MRLSSKALGGRQVFPVQYTCDGRNINPDLQIDGVPEEARSLVLIMDDPDAPIGTFTHWLVWNIDPDASHFRENGVPQGVYQGRNDTGKVGYIGPCPPNGTHRYFFHLYALDTRLELKEGSQRQDLEEAIMGHIIAESLLQKTYARQQE